MNPEDRRAIEGLFHRLDTVESSNPHRDPEAEELIAGSIRRQPAAPYYLAQTVLVQEHALTVAEDRIRDLEAQLETARRVPQKPRGPWERDERQGDQRGGGFGGGGFLAGAAQTAMGVAGGVLLGSAIGSMFGGGQAQAAEVPAEPADDPTEAADAADAGDAGGDGDFGDFGGDGFDLGGDF